MSRNQFEGVIHVTSGKAIFFQSHYWDSPIWLPRSQIFLREESEYEYVVLVKDWLCNKKGLMEFTQYSEQQIEEMDG